MSELKHSPFANLKGKLAGAKPGSVLAKALSKSRNKGTRASERPSETTSSGIRRLNPESSFAASLRKTRSKSAKRDGYKGVVQHTVEFSRILNLPMRDLDPDGATDLTSIFKKNGGEMELRPIQSVALYEACLANGLFAPIGVGHGKTLITLLLAEAMDSQRTVLLVPPQLRDQLKREISEVYGPHFNLPLDRIVRILAYSELSLAKNTAILDELDPDLIIADECHKLANKNSSRTKRFLRFMRENPHCRFAGLSGTVTGRSLKDYAHLIELALRKNSPLPNPSRNYDELALWAGALDAKVMTPTDPGVLRLFCKPEDNGNARVGFRRRLVGTPGVVATEEGSIGTSLLVTRVHPEVVPVEVTDALEEVRTTWEYNGEVYASPLSFWRFCRQMSSGFYYRWVWPDGAPNEEDNAWLEARANWKRELRDKLKTSGEGMDSELLMTNAAERWRKKVEDHSKCTGEFIGDDHSNCEHHVWVSFEEGSEEWEDAKLSVEDDDGNYDEEDFKPGEYVTRCEVDPDAPEECTGKAREYVSTACIHYPSHLKNCTGHKTVRTGPNAKLFPCEEYIAWKKVKSRYSPSPPTEAVVISEFMIHAAIARARKRLAEGHKVIIWYVSKTIGELLEKRSGFPHFGAGTDASESEEDIIICSIPTQGTGKNLQYYSASVIVTMPTNGKEFEQLAGREHRPGQLADLVVIDYFGHTESLEKCMDDVITDAHYIEESTGQKQKILYADGEVIHKKIAAHRKLRAAMQKFENGPNKGA